MDSLSKGPLMICALFHNTIYLRWFVSFPNVREFHQDMAYSDSLTESQMFCRIEQPREDRLACN